jgi:uncharacterized protein with HEPN domain
MRREELYLTDILEAADAIQRFIQGIEREDFFGDELHQSAVLQKLIVIGEAAARLPEEFIKRHPKVEWADIVAFRNIAVHEYFAVNWVYRLGGSHARRARTTAGGSHDSVRGIRG